MALPRRRTHRCNDREESPASEICPSGYALSGLRCYGSNCDNKSLFCCPYRRGADPAGRRSWSGWISEESPNNSFRIDYGFVAGLECRGRYCDNLRGSLLTSPGLRNRGGCRTLARFSEEGGVTSICTDEEFVAGMTCSGSYCDNLTLRCCDWR